MLSIEQLQMMIKLLRPVSQYICHKINIALMAYILSTGCLNKYQHLDVVTMAITMLQPRLFHGKKLVKSMYINIHTRSHIQATGSQICVFKNLKFIPLEESWLLPNIRAVIITSNPPPCLMPSPASEFP